MLFSGTFGSDPERTRESRVSSGVVGSEGGDDRLRVGDSSATTGASDVGRGQRQKIRKIPPEQEKRSAARCTKGSVQKLGRFEPLTRLCPPYGPNSRPWTSCPMSLRCCGLRLSLLAHGRENVCKATCAPVLEWKRKFDARDRSLALRAAHRTVESSCGRLGHGRPRSGGLPAARRAVGGGRGLGRSYYHP